MKLKCVAERELFAVVFSNAGVTEGREYHSGFIQADGFVCYMCYCPSEVTLCDSQSLDAVFNGQVRVEVVYGHMCGT